CEKEPSRPPKNRRASFARDSMRAEDAALSLAESASLPSRGTAHRGGGPHQEGYCVFKNLRGAGFGAEEGGATLTNPSRPWGSRWQTKLLVAGLVAKLEWDFLFAQRSRGKNLERHLQNDGVLINVERIFREDERFEFALGIGDFAGREARGDFGLEVSGDEVL